MDKLLEESVDDRTAGVLNTIGRNIRQLRMERSLTLQALAEHTGLSPSMLSLLERGKTGPSIGTLVVIAASLGAQMSDLMDQTGSGDGSIVSRAEFGGVLDGTLEVTVSGQAEILRAGDLISYSSLEPHRFANTGTKRARTLWINLRRP